MAATTFKVGDLVGYTSANGRVSMCARVIAAPKGMRPASAGSVWIRENGLRWYGEAFVCEAPVECLTLAAS